THRILFSDAARPSTAYAEVDERLPFPPGHAGSLEKTLDGGATWSRLRFPLPLVIDFLRIAVDPTNPSILYANVFYLEAGTGLELFDLFKTDDGGLTWTRIGKRQAGNVLAIDPRSPEILYAVGHDMALVRSTNAGKTWSAAGNNVKASFVVFDPADRSTLYAG